MSEAIQMGRILSGFTVCPCCLITKRAQEERMAVPAEYDRIFCFSCLCSSNSLKPDHLELIKSLPASYADLVSGLISYQHSRKKAKVIVPYRLMQVHRVNELEHSEQALSQDSKRIKFVFALDRQKGDDIITLTICNDASPDHFDTGRIKLSAPAVNHEIKNHLSGQVLPLSRFKALKELVSRGFIFKHVKMHSCIRSIALIYEGKHGITPESPEAEFKWHFC